MKLFDIAEDVRSLQNLLEDAADDTGELPADTDAIIDAWFHEISASQNDKLDSYVMLLREKELLASARREEMERLQKRVKADETFAKRLKDRLQTYLVLTKQSKVETDRYKLSVVNNGGKLPVQVGANPDELPDELCRIRREPDADAIRTVLEAGQKVPGCFIGERGRHLRIS